MNKERSEISGTWKQTGVSPQPLSFSRRVSELSSKPAAGTPAHAPHKPLSTPLDVFAPVSPAPFKADGKWHLVYELRITNFDDSDCTITDIEFTNLGKSPISVSGATLEGLTGRPQQKSVTQLGPWTFTVVYVWLTADQREEIPSAIQHRIHMKGLDYPEELTVEPPPVPVEQTPVALIEPPLRGGEWLAANGPSNTSAHRRALFPFDGRARIGQRFAIDWIELYPEGKSYRGEPRDNKNYRAYGAKIHAVADGIVTAVEDGLPENFPDPHVRAVTITAETAAGNHVVVDIGNGRYAAFAHLQPGSIQVKVGDKVHTGQILGLVGNSGNSTEPHLHFQICNANSVLSCEGLPYAFSAFEVQGRWAPDPLHPAPAKHENEIPTEGEVVKFPPEATKTKTP